MNTNGTLSRSLGISGAIGLVIAAISLPAQDASISRVLVKEGKVLATQGGQTMSITKEITLPGDIQVNTNGAFKVQQGKERQLREGQAISADGMLSSPDGSLVPVFDHIAAKNGRAVICRDGLYTPLSSDFQLPTGGRITPDAYRVDAAGRRTKILDGQLTKLDGGLLASRDTVMLKNGQVIVQKDGSRFPVPSGRSLMMNNGFKVLGDGTVVLKDGTRKKLVEGEILAIDGVVRH